MQAELCDGSNLWRRAACSSGVAFALGGSSLNERRGSILGSELFPPGVRKEATPPQCTTAGAIPCAVWAGQSSWDGLVPSVGAIPDPTAQGGVRADGSPSPRPACELALQAVSLRTSLASTSGPYETVTCDTSGIRVGSSICVGKAYVGRCDECVPHHESIHFGHGRPTAAPVRTWPCVTWRLSTGLVEPRPLPRSWQAQLQCGWRTGSLGP
jgi:hypothetical protein